MFETYLRLFRKVSGKLERMTAVVAREVSTTPDLLIEEYRKPFKKPSIQDFIEHELKLYEKRQKLLEDFLLRVNSTAFDPEFPSIKICDSSSFAFLKSPFPVI